jgi:hypothetical protein
MVSASDQGCPGALFLPPAAEAEGRRGSSASIDLDLDLARVGQVE